MLYLQVHGNNDNRKIEENTGSVFQNEPIVISSYDEDNEEIPFSKIHTKHNHQIDTTLHNTLLTRPA